MTAPDYSLLPKDKTFGQLAPAFILPYFAYVGLGSFIHDLELRSILRLAVVAGLLLVFRKSYRLGLRMAPRAIPWILVTAAFATALWIASLRFCLDLPWWHGRVAAAAAAEFSPLYVALRGLNSVLLVPLFEEFLCRAYIPEILKAGRDALQSNPQPLDRPPLTRLAVAGSTVFFAFGHDGPAIVPAMIYFLFTSWIYARTRSFRVVVAVHALVNLAIAVLAATRPEWRFLWA